MEIYFFGFDIRSSSQQSVSDKRERSDVPTSTNTRRLLDGSRFEILWTSWCDAVISCDSFFTDSSTRPPTIKYIGTGLSTSGIELLENTITSCSSPAILFGNPLHSGLQGAIVPNAKESEKTNVYLFHLDQKQEIETIHPPNGIEIRHIAITHSGHVAMIISDTPHSGTTQSTHNSTQIFHFPTIDDFRSWLQGKENSTPIYTTTHHFTSLLANSTTFTALTTTGQVLTWSPDARFPHLQGRETSSAVPEPVSYLSETRMVKIASGGYMTAALGEDGELYLWGQACPGTGGELKVLSGKSGLRDEYDMEEDEDDVVKVVSMKETEDERVTDVAVGSGHVLFVVTACIGGLRSSCVYAAGQNESGQLGLETTAKFVESFREVETFRGRKVESLVCAGWSSWVALEKG